MDLPANFIAAFIYPQLANTSLANTGLPSFMDIRCASASASVIKEIPAVAIVLGSCGFIITFASPNAFIPSTSAKLKMLSVVFNNPFFSASAYASL